MSDNDDALVRNLRETAGMMRRYKATSIEAHELDDAANTIESLTTELNKWRKIAGEMAGAISAYFEAANRESIDASPQEALMEQALSTYLIGESD